MMPTLDYNSLIFIALHIIGYFILFRTQKNIQLYNGIVYTIRHDFDVPVESYCILKLLLIHE